MAAGKMRQHEEHSRKLHEPENSGVGVEAVLVAGR